MKKLKSSYTVLVLIDVLFSIVHIVNMIAIGDSKDLALIPLALGDLLFCLIYLSIHGIVAYSVYRSVFYPHIITGAVLLITTIGMFLSPLGNGLCYSQSIQETVITNTYELKSSNVLKAIIKTEY